MTIDFESVFVTATGQFMPGEPVDNDQLDRFIAPLNGRCSKIKRRILAENGILTRHYAIDEQGRTRFSAAQLASRAAQDCLAHSEVKLRDVSVLCTGSTGGDLAVPGFANMVQGELAAGPMLTSSHQGVCASGMAALHHAASALTLGDHAHALVIGCEMPSRMFKRSRFAPREYQADFAAHFLRYMLSDGAGALLLSSRPQQQGLSLRLDWLHFVPESGRFTISFAQLTVVGPDAADDNLNAEKIVVPHQPDAASTPRVGALIAELAGVWHDYQSRLRRTPLLRRITTRSFTREDYLRWMSAWIPQVRSGSQWMRQAADHVREPFLDLVPLIGLHADDEQDDYRILFDDYRSAGGKEESLDALRRNPGGEALNAFMFRSAERINPIDLLGAIYIIEGTGQRVIPQLLPALRSQLNLPERAFRFLRYHGTNDEAHLARWLQAIEIVLAADASPASARRIVETARATAELYLLQFQYLGSD